MTIEVILVPDLGGVDSVEVIELSISPGNRVELDESILVLESDKASMDVPSTAEGVLSRYLVKEGDSVNVGLPIAEIEIDSAKVTSISKEPVSINDVQSNTKNAQNEVNTDSNNNDVSDEMVIASVPDTGSSEALEVLEVLVSVGDKVYEGDTLVTLESDKASMDVPARVSGIVTEILAVESDKLSTGDPIVRLKRITEDAVAGDSSGMVDLVRPLSDPKKELGTDSYTNENLTSAKDAKIEATILPISQGHLSISSDVYAGPSVRLAARELGVDLTIVNGSGPRGRITREDLNRFVAKNINISRAPPSVSDDMLPQSEIDFESFGAVERIRMSKVEVLTARNMKQSWSTIPHVTHFDDADITELESFRKSLSDEAIARATKLTPLAFIIKSVAIALRANSKFNRSLLLNSREYLQRSFINIGIAVDTQRGLVVPVVRDVDKKGIWELADEVLMVAEKARQGKLSVMDMQGGCFTISSLGALGGSYFTPIVNSPEVAILGVSKATMKPHWNGVEFLPRLLLPLSLSYDHRIVNGADAGRFMGDITRILFDIRQLAMF
ncbi:MAG: dihydrolipoamide acetyltransferase [Porticoccaceae bacterium]|nr:dihydrolipoamide acetyltransferase [Porticoccaceae bacterium]